MTKAQRLSLIYVLWAAMVLPKIDTNPTLFMVLLVGAIVFSVFFVRDGGGK